MQRRRGGGDPPDATAETSLSRMHVRRGGWRGIWILWTMACVLLAWLSWMGHEAASMRRGGDCRVGRVLFGLGVILAWGVDMSIDNV